MPNFELYINHSMRTLQHIGFWILVAIFLVVSFAQADQDYIKTLYFVTFLMPVAVGTSYFFNYFLVPKYLLLKKYVRFVLYLTYTLIFSLYFEMLVLTLSFIVLANYRYENLHPYSANLLMLTFTIYLIVFINAFILLIRRYQRKEYQIIELESEHEKNKIQSITVRSDRKNVPIAIQEIRYIESLADYVKIHTGNEQIITKEKISELDQRLPEYFIRTHRSFLVNQNHIKSYNREEIMLDAGNIPISRTYKKHIITLLEAQECK